MAGQRLKMKDELSYKKGGTSASCSGCNHFVKDFKRHGLGGDFIALEGRCLIMGLEHSVKYRVHPDNICRVFDGSLHLLRLMGDTRFLETYGQAKFDLAKKARADRDHFDQHRKY